MKPWESLGTTQTPDGSWLELRRHDGEYVIRADGYDLMTSRMHGSEDAMMQLALPNPRGNACVLIGGLGMGFTLRATLDRLSPEASVVVGELVPQVVEWNRGPMGDLAGNPLDDPRTTLIVGDICDIIRNNEDRFDAILLDVDNGPDAFTQKTNFWLYTRAGLGAANRALRHKGALAVWSVGGDPNFERHLTTAGFAPSTHKVNAHGKRGVRQVVFVGKKRHEPHDFGPA